MSSRQDAWLGRGECTRYTVEPQGEGWTIHDTRCDNRVVRWYPSQAVAIAQSFIGNILGPCSCCPRPASVQIMGEPYCVDCLPEGEAWGLIPLAALRAWRDSPQR